MTLEEGLSLPEEKVPRLSASGDVKTVLNACSSSTGPQQQYSNRSPSQDLALGLDLAHEADSPIVSTSPPIEEIIRKFHSIIFKQLKVLPPKLCNGVKRFLFPDKSQF